MKLPRDVSGADAVKALRRLGFEKTRQTGAHIRLSRGGCYVTVPQHQRLAPQPPLGVFLQPTVNIGDHLSVISCECHGKADQCPPDGAAAT